MKQISVQSIVDEYDVTPARIARMRRTGVIPASAVFRISERTFHYDAAVIEKLFTKGRGDVVVAESNFANKATKRKKARLSSIRN